MARKTEENNPKKQAGCLGTSLVLVVSLSVIFFVLKRYGDHPAPAILSGIDVTQPAQTVQKSIAVDPSLPPSTPSPVRPNSNARVTASGAWLVLDRAAKGTWETACRAEDEGNQDKLEALARQNLIFRLDPGVRLIVGEVGADWCDVLTRNAMEVRRTGRVRLDRVAGMDN